MNDLWDTLTDEPILPAVPPVASANADPDTSAEAEAEHTASGRREANCQLVLRLLRLYPEYTAQELYAAALALHADGRQLGASHHEVNRRLSDLMRVGKAKQGPARTCRVAGRKCVTWRAT